MLLLTKNAAHASGGQQHAMVIRAVWPRCQSPQHKKNGPLHHGKPHHQGHDCGRQVVDGFAQHLVSADTRALIEHVLVERIAWRGSCRTGGANSSGSWVSWSTAARPGRISSVSGLSPVTATAGCDAWR